MVDREVFERLVKELKNALDFLKQRQGVAEEIYLTDEALQAAVERKLEIAIQFCIDIGSHIVSERNLPYPETYKGIFATLGQERIVSLDLSERLEGMAGFRNLLVHDYARIDARKVFQILRHELKDIEDYLKEIVDFLRL